MGAGMTSERPDKSKRTFTSEKIEEYILDMCKKIKDEKVAKLFTNCYPNTLDTTIDYTVGKDTFIITGDIKAMWLRDSSFQIYPYLKHCKNDEKLNDMILCLFNRQIKSILLDPYANAYNKYYYYSPWYSDLTYKIVNGKRELAMNSNLWERKFELDSLMCPFFIMSKYSKFSNNFDYINKEYFDALNLTIKVVEDQMKDTDEEDEIGYPEYSFQRKDKEPFDSQHQGRGNPCKRCGLVKCNFRNSDDSTLFPFNIPENALLVCTFNLVIETLTSDNVKNTVQKNFPEIELDNIISKLENLSKGIKDSIYKYGIIKDKDTNESFFAYEIDGYDNSYFMDDPGYPSLISLPFFGFIKEDDPLYVNTRKRILSCKNPYYIKGQCGEGVASSHSYRRYVWPLFILMRGITSNNEKEIMECLNLLIVGSHERNYMNESFDIDNPENFTRSWFAWANSFFGIFIETILEKHPSILEKFKFNK